MHLMRDGCVNDHQSRAPGSLTNNLLISLTFLWCCANANAGCKILPPAECTPLCDFAQRQDLMIIHTLSSILAVISFLDHPLQIHALWNAVALLLPLILLGMIDCLQVRLLR